MNDSSTDYRLLLATVDLGEVTEQVVARSADLGRRFGASVELANILDTTSASLIRALSSGELQEIRDKTTRWSQTRLGELKARVPGVRAIHTSSGVLADEISTLVTQIDADLLVVGAHDRRGLGVLFFDHSDEILHGAPCDVFVVKQSSDMQSADGPVPYRHVAAALDLEAGAPRILARAARMADIHEASLTLLHVIDHFPVDRSNAVIAPEDQDPLTFEREDRVRRLGELAEAAGIEACQQEVMVSTSTASREIPAFAKAKGVDLLIAGSHGRHGLGRLLGSTADGILHRASCDLLVVRQPDGV